MRLDHLLSKEHLSSPFGVVEDRLLTRVWWGRLLIDQWNAGVCDCVCLVCVSSTALPSGVGVERYAAGGCGCSAHCWVLREHPHFGCCLARAAAALYRFRFDFPVWGGGGWWWVTWGGGVWLFFENYTVDASIFVVKLLRAHGGCLGIRSR